MTFSVHNGDCLEWLRSLPGEHADAIVTDPPAGIGFMGKAWDRDKGGRAQWVVWMEQVAAECLRVLKPGGHALVWALPRTSHWTGWAWESAGWEPRDKVVHLFGTGFPKSLDVSKAIDKAAGAEREVVGQRTVTRDLARHGRTGDEAISPVPVRGALLQVTAPATDAARQWDGWGTALKPASEDWWLFRKPLVGTVAANVTTHGTGALNVDGCRIGTTAADAAAMERCNTPGSGRWLKRSPPTNLATGGAADSARALDTAAGRWPANLVLTCACDGEHEPGCAVAMLDEQSGELTSGSVTKSYSPDPVTSCSFGAKSRMLSPDMVYADSGGASRFFYVAKATREEREAGLESLEPGWVDPTRSEGSDGRNSPRAGAGRSGGRRNRHPTVKSIALMRWLVRLVTPPGGLVLDPFTGSGTTGCAAMQERVSFAGCELDPEHAEVARLRIAHWVPRQRDLFADAAPPPSQPQASVPVEPVQPSLFDEPEAAE